MKTFMCILLLAATANAAELQGPSTRPERFEGLYATNCAVCHGDDMTGEAQGGALVGVEFRYGDAIDEIVTSIANGSPQAGMPAWSETLTPIQMRQLAILISERRKGFQSFGDFNVDPPFELPSDPIATATHRIRLELVADGFSRYPYSIAPMPDGRILLTEKTRGLTIISRTGEQSDLVAGAPIGHEMAYARDQLQLGTGYVMDVALHPDYADNGWIYIHFGDRCGDCPVPSRPESSRSNSPSPVSRDPRSLPPSMNKLVRGRITDGKWVDEETIWEVPTQLYTPSTEMAAGGRIAFDPEGYVFISVGMKAGYDGIQDLAFPYGKIHRVHDDGRIPTDNPFLDVEGAYPTTWTLGHRSPQGLEFDPKTRRLWGTEMGPRGGDEVNWLRPGRNYGWPLFSKGVHYNGQPVAGGGQTEVTIDDIEQPVVDLTPGPAVSSMVVYHGEAFPEWKDSLLVATLKGSELYRIVIDDDGKLVSRETLFGPLARIRDIEVEPDGNVLVLLEHKTDSQIVRLRPAPLDG